jgi:hypothetical protein
MMVSELASRSSESSPELLSESLPELLTESSSEEMRSTNITLLPGSLLEESALTSMRVDRFFLRVEEKIPCLSMASIAGVRQLSPCARVRLPPLGRRRTDLFHGASSETHRGGTLGQLLFVTAVPHSLGGAADSTEEDRRGRGRRASFLQNLPLESWAIPVMERMMRRRRGRRKLEKGIEGGRQGRAFIKKVRMCK